MQVLRAGLQTEAAARCLGSFGGADGGQLLPLHLLSLLHRNLKRHKTLLWGPGDSFVFRVADIWDHPVGLLPMMLAGRDTAAPTT